MSQCQDNFWVIEGFLVQSEASTTLGVCVKYMGYNGNPAKIKVTGPRRKSTLTFATCSNGLVHIESLLLLSGYVKETLFSMGNSYFRDPKLIKY